VTAGALQELAGKALGPGGCHVFINRVACTETAVSTWEGGCVHEHVTAGIGICAGHRKLAERPFTCVLCEPDHECTALLREVTP
jgi:hypothetical protein